MKTDWFSILYDTFYVVLTKQSLCFGQNPSADVRIIYRPVHIVNLLKILSTFSIVFLFVSLSNILFVLNNSVWHGVI